MTVYRVYWKRVDNGISPGFADVETASLWADIRHLGNPGSRRENYTVDPEKTPENRCMKVNLDHNPGWDISDDGIATHESIPSKNQYGDVFP